MTTILEAADHFFAGFDAGLDDHHPFEAAALHWQQPLPWGYPPPLPAYPPDPRPFGAMSMSFAAGYLLGRVVDVLDRSIHEASQALLFPLGGQATAAWHPSQAPIFVGSGPSAAFSPSGPAGGPYHGAPPPSGPEGSRYAGYGGHTTASETPPSGPRFTAYRTPEPPADLDRDTPERTRKIRILEIGEKLNVDDPTPISLHADAGGVIFAAWKQDFTDGHAVLDDEDLAIAGRALGLGDIDRGPVAENYRAIAGQPAFRTPDGDLKALFHLSEEMSGRVGRIPTDFELRELRDAIVARKSPRAVVSHITDQVAAIVRTARTAPVSEEMQIRLTGMAVARDFGPAINALFAKAVSGEEVTHVPLPPEPGRRAA